MGARAPSESPPKGSTRESSGAEGKRTFASRSGGFTEGNAHFAKTQACAAP